MKTALEELIEVLKENDMLPLPYPHDIEEFLTKEQQQRAELIKSVSVESYDEGWENGNGANGIRGVEMTGTQFYNEVIKPKQL